MNDLLPADHPTVTQWTTGADVITNKGHTQYAERFVIVRRATKGDSVRGTSIRLGDQKNGPVYRFLRFFKIGDNVACSVDQDNVSAEEMMAFLMETYVK